MTKYKNKYRIESTRLKGWDYASGGYYFITICTKNRECLFGNIVNDIMFLNEYGNIVEKCWYDLPDHYSNIQLDQFVVMPNHVHGIMVVNNDNDMVETGFNMVETGFNMVETGFKPVSTVRHGLFEFVRALKTFSARRINELRSTSGISIWQTRFYDHIIRNEIELNRIRKYIVRNPVNWKNDDNYIHI